MLKFVRVLLPLALVGGIVVLPGCGGGSSSIDSVARYAGTYDGTFKGTLTSDKTAFSGTLTFTASSSGNVTGTITQGTGADNVTFPLSGTVSSDGHVQFTAYPNAPDTTVLATITATISNVTTGAFTGSFVTVTTADSKVGATGTITGARATTK